MVELVVHTACGGCATSPPTITHNDKMRVWQSMESYRKLPRSNRRQLVLKVECVQCMRATSRKTTGAIYANDRCDVCEQQEPRRLQGSGRRQTAVFINHQATMTSIELTHVPVHERIRTSFNNLLCHRRSTRSLAPRRLLQLVQPSLRLPCSLR